MRRLAILGAGGHGKVVAEAAELSGWDYITFFDDHWPHCNSKQYWPISGTFNDFWVSASSYDGAIIAVGDNQLRFRICQKILALNIPLSTIIHPTAAISRHVNLNPGTVIFSGVSINPGVKLGIGTIINTNASVDHDCQLGEAVHISPGAHLAGGVIVGDLSWVGIGAVVREKIIIGKKVIVGAGAVVIRDVEDGQTVVGVPADKKEILYV